MRAKIILLLVLLILFTIFVSKNTQEVDVWFFFWPINISKIVLLILTLVIGVIIGLLTSSFFYKGKEKESGTPLDESNSSEKKM